NVYKLDRSSWGNFYQMLRGIATVFFGLPEDFIILTQFWCNSAPLVQVPRRLGNPSSARERTTKQGRGTPPPHRRPLHLSRPLIPPHRCMGLGPVESAERNKGAAWRPWGAPA